MLIFYYGFCVFIIKVKVLSFRVRVSKDRINFLYLVYSYDNNGFLNIYQMFIVCRVYCW